MSTGIKPMAIALLVIGLIVGGGAGYIVSDNSLKPKIDDLEAQRQGLESDIQTKSTQISDLESVIDETEDDITELEEEKSEAGSDLAEVLETLEEKQETVNELLEEKNRIEDLVEPNPGHYKFRMFGLSFDYPKDWELEVVDVKGEAAVSSWSSAIATYNDGERDLGVTWMSIPYYDGILDVYWNETIPLYEDVYDMTLLSVNYTTISGYRAKTITMSDTIDGRFQYSIMATFYSDSDNKLYIVQYNTPTEAELEGHDLFFESIRVEG